MSTFNTAFVITFNVVFAILNFLGYAERKRWYNLAVGILCSLAVVLNVLTF